MADRHAGFAAAFAISQRALEGLAKAIYFAGQFVHRLSGVAPGIFSNQSVSFSDVFLDVPTFEILRANQGKIGLKLHGWGPVTVTPNNQPQAAEICHCELDLLVRLTPRAVLVKGRLAIIFDAATATLDTLTIRPFPGSSFSAATQTYLDSSELRFLLELAVRIELSKRGPLLPPFDISFVGAMATDPSTTATLAIVDNAIVLGLDVNAVGVTTMGDKSLLTNFLKDRDIGIWTNPVAVPIAFASMQKDVDVVVTKQGATLQAFSLTVEEGGFRVSGTAGQAEGGVTFSLLASPVLVKGPKPADDELAFWMSDVQVNVYPAWWVVIFEVLTIGIVAAIVELLVTMVRSNIVNAIKVAPLKGVAPLSVRFNLPGVTQPEIMLRIVAFECHAEGIFAGLTLSANFRSSKIVGPAVVAAEEVPTLRAHPLVYRADLGFDALSDDPTLRVRWTVRVARSNTSILVKDVSVAASGAFLIITDATVPLLTHGFFRVECRLYRVFGARVVELFDQQITLAVDDRLDRSHPYVRWMHQVLVPIVRREADGSRTILGEAIKTRNSKIHRTAIPGRCRMASHYSQSWIFFETGGPGPTLQYLEALPFARADLIANRAQVCDYCFFGGPTKKVPLIP